MQELAYFLLLGVIVLSCLYLSNRAFDAGLSHWLARKISHIGGGVAYILMPFLFSGPWLPIALSGGFFILLTVARLARPQLFRGVGGTGRKDAIAEIHFPLSGTISLIVLWAWLGEPRLAVIPPAFLGIGDAVTGILRERVSTKYNKSIFGSLAMLVTCLLIAALSSPYWIGAAAAGTATIAERYTKATQYIDDNFTLTLSAVAVITGLIIWTRGLI